MSKTMGDQIPTPRPGRAPRTAKILSVGADGVYVELLAELGERRGPVIVPINVATGLPSLAVGQRCAVVELDTLGVSNRRPQLLVIARWEA